MAGYNCETSTCNCIFAAFGTGTYSGPTAQQDCWNDPNNCCTQSSCPTNSDFFTWPLAYQTNGCPFCPIPTPPWPDVNIALENQSSYCEWCDDWANNGSVPGTFDSRAWGYDESCCGECPPPNTNIEDTPPQPAAKIGEFCCSNGCLKKKINPRVDVGLESDEIYLEDCYKTMEECVESCEKNDLTINDRLFEEIKNIKKLM
jgi:hypothetical protein